MKESTKETIKFIASVLVLVAGIALVFIGLFMPPKGVIDATVLTALGELLAFVGGCWGMAQYATVQMSKIKGVAMKYRAVAEFEDEIKKEMDDDESEND